MRPRAGRGSLAADATGGLHRRPHDRQVFSIASESERLNFVERVRTQFHVFLSLVWAHFRESPELIRTACWIWSCARKAGQR